MQDVYHQPVEDFLEQDAGQLEPREQAKDHGMYVYPKLAT